MARKLAINDGTKALVQNPNFPFNFLEYIEVDNNTTPGKNMISKYYLTMQNIAMKAEPLQARKAADWTMLRNSPFTPFLLVTLPLNTNDNLHSITTNC